MNWQKYQWDFAPSYKHSVNYNHVTEGNTVHVNCIIFDIMFYKFHIQYMCDYIFCHLLHANWLVWQIDVYFYLLKLSIWWYFIITAG